MSKIQKNDKGFSVVELAFLLVVVIVVALASVYVYSHAKTNQLGQKSLSSANSQRRSTDCFTAQVPKGYVVTGANDTTTGTKSCQFAATLDRRGSIAKAVDLVVPFKTIINNEDEARKALLRTTPSATHIVKVKVGSYDAVGIDASTHKNGVDTYTRTYIAFSPKKYTIQHDDGASYETNAFFVRIIVPELEKSHVLDALKIDWK